MSGSSKARTGAVTAAALGIALAISGCGTSPMDAASTPTPTLTASATIEPVVNDLANGSVQRTLTAGAITVTADYYSTLSMEQWTAAANKPLTFNLKATLSGDTGQEVYLSRVTLLASVNGPNGALSSPAAISDTATVSPGYPMKDPYTYNQTFILPAVDETATSLTVSFTYELLLQTTPTSTEYAKQTATDTLTIAIAE